MCWRTAGGSDIVLASGVLSLGGFTVTGGVVTAEGGLLADGHLRCDGLTKVGEKVLTIATGIDATTPIVISEGVLQLRGARPGLYEAPVAGAFNTTEAMSTSIVTRLTTRMANIVYTEPYYTTWILQGLCLEPVADGARPGHLPKTLTITSS